jgi:hypothetical protein
MGKNQDPGFGINIPDPQHWWIDTSKDNIKQNIIPIQQLNYIFSDVRKRCGAAGGAGGQEAEAGALRNLSRLSQ